MSKIQNKMKTMINKFYKMKFRKLIKKMKLFKNKIINNNNNSKIIKM